MCPQKHSIYSASYLTVYKTNTAFTATHFTDVSLHTPPYCHTCLPTHTIATQHKHHVVVHHTYLAKICQVTQGLPLFRTGHIILAATGPMQSMPHPTPSYYITGYATCKDILVLSTLHCPHCSHHGRRRMCRTDTYTPHTHTSGHTRVLSSEVESQPNLHTVCNTPKCCTPPTNDTAPCHTAFTPTPYSFLCWCGLIQIAPWYGWPPPCTADCNPLAPTPTPTPTPMPTPTQQATAHCRIRAKAAAMSDNTKS